MIVLLRGVAILAILPSGFGLLLRLPPVLVQNSSNASAAEAVSNASNASCELCKKESGDCVPGNHNYTQCKDCEQCDVGFFANLGTPWYSLKVRDGHTVEAVLVARYLWKPREYHHRVLGMPAPPSSHKFSEAGCKCHVIAKKMTSGGYLSATLMAGSVYRSAGDDPCGVWGTGNATGDRTSEQSCQNYTQPSDIIDGSLLGDDVPHWKDVPTTRGKCKEGMVKYGDVCATLCDEGVEINSVFHQRYTMTLLGDVDGKVDTIDCVPRSAIIGTPNWWKP